MRRSWVPLLAVLVLGGAVPAAVAAEGAPAPPTAPAQTPTVLPPTLLALEQKMEALKVTSLRFSAQTSITVPRKGHEILRFLKLLGDSRVSGEETISPPAGNITLNLFGGHPFTLRVVGKTMYVYVRALGRVDHGRPWIRLGRGGLAELVTEENGKHIKVPKTPAPTIGEPALAEPPFAGLRKVLAGAEEVREVGAGTLYGQPVTNFLAILEPAQLEREHLASTSRLLPPPTQPPTVTLETSLAQDGLPVRTVITERDKGTVVTVKLDIPAINFPLVIAAPPASRTITVARLRELERRARRHHRSKRKK